MMKTSVILPTETLPSGLITVNRSGHPDRLPKSGLRLFLPVQGDHCRLTPER